MINKELNEREAQPTCQVFVFYIILLINKWNLYTHNHMFRDY